MAKNHYNEIDKVIKEYENGKTWHTKNINWAADFNQVFNGKEVKQI